MYNRWIDLRQTKTKLIIGPFYTYRWIHFTSGIAFRFCDIFEAGDRRSGGRKSLLSPWAEPQWRL